MTSFQVAAGKGNYRVEAVVAVCGSDICASICGGTKGHIGATAISLSRPSLRDPTKKSSSTSVFCVVGHKEDDLARKSAERITSIFAVTTCVTVGIHVDHASAQDITTLMSNFDTVVEAIISGIKSEYVS